MATPLPNGQTLIPQTVVTGYTSSLSVLLLAVAANALAWANPATQLTIVMEVSYDGAVTWLPGGGTSHNGEAGSPIAALNQFGGQFSYGSIPTHFRGTITIANGPLTLAGTVSVS